MTDRQTQATTDASSMQMPPERWTIGDQPMTGAQRSYLTTLCEKAKVVFADGLTKAEASRRIHELQKLKGEGTRSTENA